MVIGTAQISFEKLAVQVDLLGMVQVRNLMDRNTDMTANGLLVPPYL